MIEKLFERAHSIGNNAPALPSRRRLAVQAEELNRAGIVQAQLDVCIASMVALIKILYAVDADGRPVNIDEATGRIMVPLPWGSSGWRRWGLRKWEAELLRRFLIDRWGDRRDKLFAYDDGTRQWYIDTELYQDREAALSYLKAHGPKLNEWRGIVDSYRERESVRTGRYRFN